MTYPGEQPPTAGQPPYWPPQPQPQPQQPAYGPPPGYPAGPPVKPPNPKLVFWTSAPGVISMLAIAGVLMLVLVGITNLLSGPSGDNFEVSVTSCDASGTTSLATARIGLSVKNVGKTTRSATVKVEYRDAGGARLDTDTAYVRNIAPGDTARAEESTLLEAAPAGAIRCEVTGVS